MYLCIAIIKYLLSDVYFYTSGLKDLNLDIHADLGKYYVIKCFAPPSRSLPLRVTFIGTSSF